MDYLTFISEIVKSLVWPGLVLTAGISFRKNLRNLIDRLRSIDGTKMDFEAVEIAKEKIVALEVEAQPIKDEVNAVEAKIIESENKPEREELIKELNEKNVQLRKLSIESDMLRVQLIAANNTNPIYSYLESTFNPKISEFQGKKIISDFKKMIISLNRNPFSTLSKSELDNSVIEVINSIYDGQNINFNFSERELEYLREKKIIDQLNSVTKYGFSLMKTIPES